MIMVDEIYNSFDKKYQVDVVYTDFSKALDFVNFDILIKKLHMYNVPKEYMNWYDNFLRNKIIKVKINDSWSESFMIPSVVRQGSHSGPNLFKIYINDLPDIIKYSKILLFADDVKLVQTIQSIYNCTELQEDLKSFSMWCINNDMLLNIDKCSIISYYKSELKWWIIKQSW